MPLNLRRQIGIVMWILLLFVAVIWSNLRSTSMEATGMGFAPPIEVSSLETGRLMTLKVNLHDQVSADEIVALLDREPLEQQRGVLAAQVEAAEFTIVEEGDDAENDRQRNAMKRAQLQADINADQALIVGLRRDKLIAEDLLAKGAGSANEIRRIENEISVAQGRIAGNQAGLMTVGTGDPNSESPVDADWHAVAARRMLEVMDGRLERMDVKTAIDGQVTMIYKEPGEIVFGGEPVLQVTKTGTTEVLAFLPTPSAIGLDAGSAAWVVRGTGQVIKGALVSVGSSPQALPEQLWHNPAYPEWGVPVRIKLAKGEIGPGELVTVRI